ncbi:hypothetical protein [Paenibacillus sp. FSL L8-0641]|uniref:hypothetical protein n=1 Tax=Paenibacillus sp. FSL L8-0641 TaxID=2921605 RepID=UPI0030F6E2F6
MYGGDRLLSIGLYQPHQALRQERQRTFEQIKEGGTETIYLVSEEGQQISGKPCTPNFRTNGTTRRRRL